MPSNILLIRPSICIRKGFYMQSKMSPPIGLAYIAGSLMAAGHKVKILDMVAACRKPWSYNATHDCYGLPDDANGDCYIGLSDFANIGAKWLQCMDPAEACDEPWAL